MSEESVDVFKEKILEALDRLVEKKPIPRQDGETYIVHLRNRISTHDAISVREIIENLASAGYGIEDIMQFLYSIGLITTQDDWIKYRDAVRRIIMGMERE